MIKEDQTVQWVKFCADCTHYGGLSKDTMGRIYCKSEDCSAYYGNIEEYAEEGNHELVSPAYWGLVCEWFKERSGKCHVCGGTREIEGMCLDCMNREGDD